MAYSRRAFLGTTVGSVMAWPLLSHAARQDADPGKVFRHGVASGDPLTDRVVLWTRATPKPGRAPASSTSLRWRIAEDDRLARVVSSGTAQTSAARDYTVKVDAASLKPGRTYYYAFDADGEQSPVGRTRTLPLDDVARLRAASVSCSNYPAGYFNVYRCIANRADLDVVIHLGDYIYEFGNGVYGDGSGSGRVPLPAGEAVTLAEYRLRYASYRSDVDLQAAHATHPFITVWDDHEFANDAWIGGAGNHNAGEGDWQTRRKGAAQAYMEWMPVREVTSPDLHLYRSFRFGKLADLLMLDTRSLRDKQAEAKDAATLADPSRTLMGKEQETWFYERLRRSQRDGAAWRVIGQQIMFSPLVPPGGAMWNTDIWDGYPAARNRVLDVLEHDRVSNVAILTGDIHSSWAFDVPRSPYKGYTAQTGQGSLAVEIVAPAISSPPLFARREQREAANLLQLFAPHLKFVEGLSRGYVLLDITKERLQSEWYVVPGVETRGAEEKRATALVCESGSAHLVPA